MALEFRYVLFDLDGTITDPCEGITNSYMYAVNKLKLKEDNPASIRNYIGAPLHSYFEIKHGFQTPEELMSGVAGYREYYGEKGIYECKVYEGMKELLEKLSNKGANIYLVTSKPDFYAEKILKHFNIFQYFKAVIGSQMGAFNKSKEELIQNLLDAHKIEKKDAIMIGDRKFDVLGAKHHDISSIGVLYGYGSKEEMDEVKPDYIAADVNELKLRLVE